MLMDDYALIVVGDLYRDFASAPGVITMSELREGKALPPNTTLVAGQGLSQRDRHFLSCIHDPVLLKNLETTKRTHKATQDNVLITELERVSEGTYECMLAIGDSLDRLADHISGLHINGMLLIEASRQACIAAIECEHPVSANAGWGLNWSRLDVKFLNYAYPGPVSILVAVRTDRSRTHQPLFHQHITFSQSGKAVSEIDFTVTLVENHKLKRLESRASKSTIEGIARDSIRTRGQHSSSAGVLSFDEVERHKAAEI